MIKKAIEYYIKSSECVTEEMPNGYLPAYYRIGNIYEESGDYKQAFENYKKAAIIEVGRTFSLSKRCYGMDCITTKLEETQLTSIALSVFVMNLFKIQKRILCALLYLFQFLDSYKHWNLQISA